MLQIRFFFKMCQQIAKKISRHSSKYLFSIFNLLHDKFLCSLRLSKDHTCLFSLNQNNKLWFCACNSGKNEFHNHKWWIYEWNQVKNKFLFKIHKQIVKIISRNASMCLLSIFNFLNNKVLPFFMLPKIHSYLFSLCKNHK